MRARLYYKYPKNRTLIIWTLLGAAAVFILLALITDIKALSEAFRDFPARLLIPIAVLSLGNYAIRYIKWQWYLSRMGHAPPHRSSLEIFLCGFALTVTPGKAGELVKTYLLKERHRAPYTASTAVLLMERFTDVAAIIVLSCLGLFLEFLPLKAAACPVLLIIAAVMLMRNRKLAGRFIDWTGRRRATRRLHEPLQTFYENGWALIEIRIMLGSLALSIVAWFLEGIGYVLVAWGLGTGISVMEGVFIYSASLIGGVLTFFAGGLGATEGSLVALGMAFGMERSVSVAAAIVIRAMTLWFAVAVGWMVFLFAPGLRAMLRKADG